MRTTAGVIVNPCKIPENYVIPISAQYQTDGRRAGLKTRRHGRESEAVPSTARSFGITLATAHQVIIRGNRAHRLDAD